MARRCADEISRLLNCGGEVMDRQSGDWRRLNAGDIAILAVDRKQLNLMRRQLSLNGVPSSMAGRGLGSVYASPESRDVLYWLDAMVSAEQRSSQALGPQLRFLATPLVGLSASDCLALADDPLKQAQWGQVFADEAQQLRRRAFKPFTAAHWPLGSGQRVLGGSDGERRISNWRQLGQLLQGQWAEGQQDPMALRQFLSRAQLDPDDSDETTLMRLETDLPAVHLSTIHASKAWNIPSFSAHLSGKPRAAKSVTPWCGDRRAPCWIWAARITMSTLPPPSKRLRNNNACCTLP